MLDVGRQLGQRLKHEPPLVHEEMGDVEVVRSADHEVSVEQDVDVERARRVPLILRRAVTAMTPEPGLQLLQSREEHHRVEHRVDADHAVEEPHVLVRLLSRPLFPRLRPVQRRGVEELDLGHGLQLRHRPAQVIEPIAQVRAHR